jgi:hypothetical protein
MADFDVFLSRVIAFAEEHLPEVAESVFGQATDLAKMRVSSFSSGEPAVNVYTVGGNFAPHTDKEALTLLVPLSPDGAFEGGGTAFWKDSHHDLNNQVATEYDKNKEGESEYNETDEKNWLPHDHVIRPQRGTGESTALSVHPVGSSLDRTKLLLSATAPHVHLIYQRLCLAGM